MIDVQGPGDDGRDLRRFLLATMIAMNAQLRWLRLPQRGLNEAFHHPPRDECLETSGFLPSPWTESQKNRHLNAICLPDLELQVWL